MSEVWNNLLILGIDRQTILLILALPIISTIVGIARHFIGLKTLSIYAPIVLTYAFLELSYNRADQVFDYASGLKYGIVIFILVFASSTFTHRLLSPLRLHYYPKMSLIFTIIGITILSALVIAGGLGRTGFVNISIFSAVLIAAVSERIIAIYAKTKFKNAFLTSLETLFLSLICYSLIAWHDFQTFLLTSPWILLIIVLVNLMVGRFTGLRLREYLRFWEILDKDYSSENGTDQSNK